MFTLAPCEKAGSVWQQLDRFGTEASWCLIFIKTLSNTPLPHYECIVDAEAIDIIDTLRKNAAVGFGVPRQLLVRTCWREGTRKAEKHNSLACKQFFACLRREMKENECNKQPAQELQVMSYRIY